LSDSPQEIGRDKRIGDLLRERREAKGITVEEAAQVTRIGKNYLNALEDEAYERLPSQAYAKGFLRVYAKYLGLSPDELIAILDNVENVPMESVNERPTPEHRRSERRVGRNKMPWLFLAVSAVVAIIISWYVMMLDKRENPPVARQQESSPQALVPQAVMPPRSSAQLPQPPSQAAPPAAESAIAIPSSQKGVILKLKVNGDGWLDITIDGAISQHYELKSGDLIEWKGDNSFLLDLGNPNAVEAEFNGRPLRLAAGAKGPLHLELKSPN